MGKEMKYVDRILKNELFIRTMKEVKEYETGRIYCHHEIEHALDVCRMAWILYLEKHLDVRLSGEEWQQKKEHIYVTGLLHDIGRARQYATGEHHSIAGVRLAEQILHEIGYPDEMIRETLEIVSEHHGREEKNRSEERLCYYIERADHLSRNCFCCDASDSCKWKEEEKNQTIVC